MNDILVYIWVFISNDVTLIAFFRMLETLLIKGLLLSFYFSLLYGGIWFVKKSLHKRMSVTANYYSWYVLVFSIILANLEVNNYFKNLFYQVFHSPTQYVHYTYLASWLLSAVWLIVVVCKLTAHILLNRKIHKSMKRMERYDDNECLAERAVAALGLRKKHVILISDYIDSPVSYGVFKKTILLPTGYEDKYTSDELYLLLLHEMAHIKNGDTVKLRMINLAECFLWVAPTILLLNKQFRRDTEILCDNCVIGIKSNDRNIYGSLILKECADRNAAMGFGFSDSYNTLKSRLDALYRYKPVKHSHALTSAVIVMLLLIASSAAHYVHADYLDIYKDANAAFRIFLSNSDYTSFEILDSGQYDSIYKVIDGEIHIDKFSLYELIKGFADKGYSQANISFYRYTLTIDQATHSSADSLSLTFNELRESDETNQYFVKRLRKIQPMENVFLFITNKL